MSPVHPSHDVVVVGAGAAGLTTTAALHAAGLDTVCLEARDRTGGRLATTSDELDLGATWFWDGEPRVAALTVRLGIAVFEQHRAGDAIAERPTGMQRVAGNPIDVPAYRYRPGAAALTAGLAAQLPDRVLRLSTPVTAIRSDDDTVEVHTDAGRLHAGHVVLAIPPALAVAGIDFHGALEPQLVRLAEATPVWMGGVVKVVATYHAPFWRAAGLAGAAISWTGPLREIHDMSGPDGMPAALFGFAPAAAAGPGFATAVTTQPARLFGRQAAQPETLHVQDWSAERWTSPPGTQHLMDYGLFGHPVYQQAALAGRLHWASTETATVHAGHVEGALLAGERAAHAVLAACSAQRAGMGPAAAAPPPSSRSPSTGSGRAVASWKAPPARQTGGNFGPGDAPTPN
ncbi:Putrescine oxidase [Micromonospora sp. MW-13]|uniref:flavin monoamine oxidase family protein n=1 Tax=Micromonospora sp. MW-13 TaxID=2094022 RepID=UPI000E430A5E|nr:NAD(P)/FAD-dependent oxidoreductase [Micromonospora sp. MW-13]RGC65265.1 Putrescine oxidase [Micromonospora sp. MW-13]